MTSLPPPIWTDMRAVFGGTFDPPHIGHLEAVRGVFLNPGIKSVIVIPSPAPPHKPTMASVQDRLEMTKITFQNETGVFVDSREVERALKHPSRPSYTYDTLCELSAEIDKLVFAIGTDQFEKLPSWYRFPEILNLANWVVLVRQPGGQPEVLKLLNNWNTTGLVERYATNIWRLKSQQKFISLVETNAPSVSSTKTREHIAQTGSPPPGWLTNGTWTYLKAHKLYGSN